MFMIYGIGHDLVEIARISQMRERSTWPRFLERILTEEERQLAEQRSGRVVEFVAGRFAAKEAVVKALGCGIGDKVGFMDIEILPDYQGKPHCTLSEQAWRRLMDAPTDHHSGHQTYHIHVSITHQPTLASAFAIFERRVDG
jgi:holo-[acyl-carrier protein] synthase